MIRDYLNNVLMKTKTKTNYLFIDDHKYEQNLTLWTAVYFAIFFQIPFKTFRGAFGIPDAGLMVFPVFVQSFKVMPINILFPIV